MTQLPKLRKLNVNAKNVRPSAGRSVSRKPTASTATGYGSWHAKEVEELLSTALD